jgi:hypothetical protein
MSKKPFRIDRVYLESPGHLAFDLSVGEAWVNGRPETEVCGSATSSFTAKEK